MSENLFTKDQVKQLKTNINVLAVNELSITYTYDFKMKFMEEYVKGIMPKEIFETSGFDKAIIGMELIKNLKCELYYA